MTTTTAIVVAIALVAIAVGGPILLWRVCQETRWLLRLAATPTSQLCTACQDGQRAGDRAYRANRLALHLLRAAGDADGRPKIHSGHCVMTGPPPAADPDDRPTTMVVRTELSLYAPYVAWLRDGRKVTTIRFREGALEVPVSDELPLFATTTCMPGAHSRLDGHVRISGVRYARFGALTLEDAVRDGFPSLPDLRLALQEIYPDLRPDSWVTVYAIAPLP